MGWGRGATRARCCTLALVSRGRLLVDGQLSLTCAQLILVDAKPSVRKQILRELQIMNDCASPYIVSYYGCFPVDVHVGIVMEFMDLG